MNWLTHLLDQYGYIVLFFSLMLELIIIPIPNEILMSYVGFLVFQGKMNFYLSILTGGLGGIIGVTISYWIGSKLGTPFFYKYGDKFHMGPKKIEQISRWNKKYGKRLLLFCFFIPGVRHITSIFSGITRVSFRYFSIFAYIGVFLWVSTFITLGKIFGPKWEKFHLESTIYIVIACIVIAGLYLIYFLIKTNKEKIKENALLLFENTFTRFQSFLKIKLLIFGVGIVFIGLFSLMIGLIQDFIANEFGHFNTIASTVTAYLFNLSWMQFMTKMNSFTSWQLLVIVGCFTFIWVLLKGKNKLLENQYYLIGIAGAIIFGKGLHVLFNLIPGIQTVSNNFPSEQTLISTVIYVFFMYAFVRNSNSPLLNTIVVLLDLFVLVFIAISRIYLKLQYPSDLVAGYVFGGAWVCFIILLIEGSRLVNLIKLSIKK